MIIHVEERDRARYADELHQYFKLRKKVFYDELNWDVIADGEIERDLLDDAPCTYTLYLGDDGTVQGGARLIPTTQTTLLEMAFDGLVPEDISFRSPTIWESSRYCVNHEAAKSRMSSGAKRATLGISIGNVDYALANGITHYIAVVEARLFRFSQNYNADVEILGEKKIGDCDVICALYTMSEKTLDTIKYLRPMVT